MTAPGQSISDARKKMCAFVKTHMAEYNSLSHSSSPRDLYDAYYALGQALHPIMDSTSPAHVGWQPWGNPLLPPWWGEWGTHGDSANTLEGIGNLTRALMQQTIDRIQHTLKGECGCDF